MASRIKRLRAYYEQLVAQASRGLKRNPDGSVIEADLRASLARLLRDKLDPDAMADSKAAAIIEALTKQPDEEDEDGADGGAMQLDLFGERYGYDPKRLVKDAEGNIIDEDHAPLSFILAELARNTEHAARVVKWNNRKARKAQHFQLWIERERAKGRDARDLIWGNCARETGVLRSKS